MSMHVVKFYAEIEIEVWAEYTPEEKPDYSELSPCPGSPAEAEPTNIIMPQLPTSAHGKEAFMDEHVPNWKEELIEKIEADNEMIAEAHAAQKELTEKYERTG